MKLPKVAVCLAAFNGMRWLPEQLDSICAQSDVEVTIFISVDSSEDGTEAWVAKQARGDGRLVLLPCGQRFGGAAQNFFRILGEVDFSGFDYVGLADQDDIWFPDKLARAHEVLCRSGASAYSSNVMAFWADGRRALIDKAQPQRRWDFLFEAAGPGCTYVMKTEFVSDMKSNLASRWSELQLVGLHDWFLYAYARASGYQWIIDKRVSMLYRQHAENQVGVNQGWRAFMHRVRKISSGWGLTQAVLIAELVGMGADAFVRSWSGRGRIDYIWLACNAWQCRRRWRDRVWFAMSCLLLSVRP